MMDTDWRPSPCPNCGRTRPGSEKPTCFYDECSSSPFYNPSKLTKEEPMPEPILTNRRVEAFKASDGSTHETLQKAVEHDLLMLVSGAPNRNQEHSLRVAKEIVTCMASVKMRGKFIKLLKELE